MYITHKSTNDESINNDGLDDPFKFIAASGTWGVIAAGSIVTFYSAFGGIRSITFTDILQFFTFGCGIPLIGFLIWNQVNYSNIEFDLYKTLQDLKFNLSLIFRFDNPKLWEMFPILLYFAIPSLTPAFYQRVAIGRNIGQVKKAFIISAFIVVAINLAIAWIPFLIYTINPNLQSGQILNFIVDNYIYPGLKGLMMIGITAMAMSTADTFMNTSSVLFANDIYYPIKLKSNHNSIDDKLLISKIFSLSLGLFAIILAITAKDLLQIILTAQAFYMPIVTVPLMLNNTRIP